MTHFSTSISTDGDPGLKEIGSEVMYSLQTSNCRRKGDMKARERSEETTKVTGVEEKGRRKSAQNLLRGKQRKPGS